jgi:7,8-dihydropterin-6-yl-methyl-4-(beta-D-ribofuranosyl)aminobenzene 5'-phosphate synthase
MYKLTTLFENLSYQRGLISGHGLSYLLETPDSKILFDTGPSNAIINNANMIKKDISEIDALVISHGHYDHSGGLMAVLERNEKAIVYLKKSALDSKYSGYENYIGFPEGWEKMQDRFHFISQKTEIAANVFLIPETPLLHTNDTHFSHFFIREKDKFVKDKFTDEQFMVVEGREHIHIISGCSHRGISNVLASASKQFNKPAGIVTGGFHLKNSSEEFVRIIAENFTSHNVQSVEVSHCTGIEQYHFLRKHFPGKVFYNHTGKVIIMEN